MLALMSQLRAATALRSEPAQPYGPAAQPLRAAAVRTAVGAAPAAPPGYGSQPARTAAAGPVPAVQDSSRQPVAGQQQGSGRRSRRSPRRPTVVSRPMPVVTMEQVPGPGDHRGDRRGDRRGRPDPRAAARPAQRQPGRRLRDDADRVAAGGGRPAGGDGPGGGCGRGGRPAVRLQRDHPVAQRGGGVRNRGAAGAGGAVEPAEDAEEAQPESAAPDSAEASTEEQPSSQWPPSSWPSSS